MRTSLLCLLCRCWNLVNDTWSRKRAKKGYKKKQHQGKIYPNFSWRFVKGKNSLFLDGFDGPPAEVEFPATVQEIIFEQGFNQSLAGVKWPPQLRVLKFSDDFDR